MKATFEYVVRSVMVLFDYEFYLVPLVLFAFMFLLYIVRSLKKWV